MARTFTLTENAVKNLISNYAYHVLMCEKNENYVRHVAACSMAEQWMRAIGIDPQSNYVTEIIEKEREKY